MKSRKFDWITLIGLMLAVAGSICAGCGLTHIGAVMASVGTAITTYEFFAAGIKLRWILIVVGTLAVACGLLTFATGMILFN